MFFKDKEKLNAEEAWSKSFDHRYVMPKGCYIKHPNKSEKRSGGFWVFYEGRLLISGAAYEDPESARKSPVTVGIPKGMCKTVLGMKIFEDLGKSSKFTERGVTLFLKPGEEKLLKVTLSQEEVAYLSVKCVRTLKKWQFLVGRCNINIIINYIYPHFFYIIVQIPRKS